MTRRLCPRCCHPGSYFKHTPFLCRYIRRDIMCKHDVINSQHAHCGLVTTLTASCPERPLPATGIPISYAPSLRLRTCEPRCLSLAATSSSLSLCTDMTSSIKPEIRHVSLRRQRRTERRPWVKITCIKNSVKIGRVFPKILSRTDRQTDTLITILRSPVGGRVIKARNQQLKK